MSKPLWHGVMLVTGGAIGAGMFALPLVSAGAWFTWSLFGLAIVWWFTYLAAKLLIEVNLQYPKGSSFDTLVRSVLGARWAALNNVSIAFIMFILMYAYITAGAGILEKSIGFEVSLSRAHLSVFFAAAIGILIWLGTSIVSRVSSVLMVAMGVSFVTANTGLLSGLDWSSLIYSKSGAALLGGDLKYLGVAIPVFVTAFACAGLVPSLCSHYNGDAQKTKSSIYIGSLLALLIYFLWLSTTLGSISRTEFVRVADQGGGLAALVGVLNEVSTLSQSGDQGVNASILSAALNWFSHFAVTTSFLSIALGLAHFLSDRFALGADRVGRLKSVLLTFVPPTIFSVLMPYGFVKAIGYAGLFVALSFFVVPSLMHARQFGSNGVGCTWQIVCGFGVLVMLLKLASILSLLPAYPS